MNRKANIELKEHPTNEDYDLVVLAAQEACECSADMKSGMIHGDETICKPCAARQVLNGLTSLADTL